MTFDQVRSATSLLQNYIEKENYRGFDPYDGLMSPLFKLPLLSNNKTLRFYSQQLIKRSPVNLRPFLGIKKGENPVTLGLCVQAYTDLASVYPEQKEYLKSKIELLIEELVKLIPLGFSGACWGYDFDWEARYVKIPAHQPTVVATGIITNALFRYYLKSKNKKAFDLCESASHFVLKDLKRTYDEVGNFCFSYSPFDKQVVFNASMKGVRLLSQVYAVQKNESLKTEAKKAVGFLMRFQQPSGAWIYSTSKAGGWIDNYHTGYVIDCLDEYIRNTNEEEYSKNLETAVQFYEQNFFEPDGTPKFYNKNVFPVDCTAAGQSLLTLCRFNKTELALKVASVMISHMQNREGYFYFRQFKNYLDKTSFMRWSNAWMFAGLTALLLKAKA